MSDRWAFSIFIEGDVATKEEFKKLFVDWVIPERLKGEIDEEDLQQDDSFACMASVVGKHGDQLCWLDHQDDMVEISGWFPTLKIHLDVDGTCQMVFSNGEMLSREGGIAEYDDDFDEEDYKDDEDSIYYDPEPKRKYSILVEGDEASKNEFDNYVMKCNCSDRLKTTELAKAGWQNESLENLYNILLGNEDRIRWEDHLNFLVIISGWFPALTITVNIDQVCRLVLLSGKVIRRKGILDGDYSYIWHKVIDVVEDE